MNKTFKLQLVTMIALATLCAGFSAQAAEEDSLSPEQIAQELTQRNTTLRGISNEFAAQQKKTALLKRDRAMFTKEAADPTLSEEAREQLRERITQAEIEMNAIELRRVKNREVFASAAQDYESFAKKNLSEETQTAKNEAMNS